MTDHSYTGVTTYTDVTRYGDGAYHITHNDMSPSVINRILIHAVMARYEDAFDDARTLLSEGQHRKTIGTGKKDVNVLILEFDYPHYSYLINALKKQNEGRIIADLLDEEEFIVYGTDVLSGQDSQDEAPQSILHGKRLLSMTAIKFDENDQKVFLRLQFDVPDDYLDHLDSMRKEVREYVDVSMDAIGNPNDPNFVFSLRVPLLFLDSYFGLFKQLITKHNDYRINFFPACKRVGARWTYDKESTMDYVSITFETLP